MSIDKQKAYEERLRKRLEILRQELEAGNIHINQGLGIVESLSAVRCGADGKIDLDTVDSGVRSLALAVEAMNHRKETKSIISLSDLQQGILRTHRSRLRKILRRHEEA